MQVNAIYPDPNSVSILKIVIANFLCKRFVFQNKAAYFLTTAGDILRLQATLKLKFGTTKHVSRRELLWNRIIQNIELDAHVYEFGVAYGYTTNYFLEHIKQNVNYQGFDRFTGLPTAWRNLAKGAFSTGGTPPAIRDERLTWIVGDINETLTSDYKFPAAKQNIFLFDFDLFSPTLHAYQMCKNNEQLTEGSLIYFDEAFDPEELLVIQNYLFQDVSLELIGSTWGAVAFRIGKKLQP